MTASSKADQPVEVVDRQLNKILDPTQIYSGMYANVCINVYPYVYVAKKASASAWDPYKRPLTGKALGAALPRQPASLPPWAAPTRELLPRLTR